MSNIVYVSVSSVLVGFFFFTFPCFCTESSSGINISCLFPLIFSKLEQFFSLCLNDINIFGDYKSVTLQNFPHDGSLWLSHPRSAVFLGELNLKAHNVHHHLISVVSFDHQMNVTQFLHFMVTVFTTTSNKHSVGRHLETMEIFCSIKLPRI